VGTKGFAKTPVRLMGLALGPLEQRVNFNWLLAQFDIPIDKTSDFI
jgi:hypothetical protein